MHQFNLRPRELEVLRFLYKSYTVQQISHAMGVSKPAVHLYCYLIRKKTGLVNWHDPQECRKAMHCSFHVTTREAFPTKSQLAVLRLLAQGKPYTVICEKLNLSIGAAMNYASQGRKRLGIGRGQRELVAALLRLDPMNDPAFFL